jgi:hypothetical protein
MYCVRKFADGWAVFNVESEASRQLTEVEVEVLRQEVPQLNDPETAAYYTDTLDCINNKP